MSSESIGELQFALFRAQQVRQASGLSPEQLQEAEEIYSALSQRLGGLLVGEVVDNELQELRSFAGPISPKEEKPLESLVQDKVKDAEISPTVFSFNFNTREVTLESGEVATRFTNKLRSETAMKSVQSILSAIAMLPDGSIIYRRKLKNKGLTESAFMYHLAAAMSLAGDNIEQIKVGKTYCYSRTKDFSVATVLPDPFIPASSTLDLETDVATSSEELEVTEIPVTNDEATTGENEALVEEKEFKPIESSFDMHILQAMEEVIAQDLTPDIPDLSSQEVIDILYERLQHPHLYRFDIGKGIYSGSHLLADASDSPLVVKNLHLITAIIDRLSELSKDNDNFNGFVPLDELYRSIPAFEEVDNLTRKRVVREVNRLLKPGQRVSLGSKSDRFWINGPFEIAYTQVGISHRSKDNKRQSALSEPISMPPITRLQEAMSWEEFSDHAAEALSEGSICAPRNAREAVMLLNHVMDEEVVEGIFNKFEWDQAQAIVDMAHGLASKMLGFTGYKSARIARTIRSGNPGMNSLVRQITGSQRAERFERKPMAAPDEERISE